jgi:SAM-dependent methyltransferase
MSVRPLFQTTWGSSLRELVGPEPADLEGALAPLAEGAKFKNTRAEVASVMVALERWLWSRNQFERALKGMQRASHVRSALRQHRKELSAWARAKLGEEPREVTCAEYTPELQLRVLSVDMLRAPVLDVGCGPNASLVRHLRERRVDAMGLDRALDAELGVAGDWLNYDYGQARFGSIVSHQSFSLHFLHHHHGSGDEAYDYARTYMNILRALVPGGLFAYAPGLPFIEGILEPTKYRVQRVAFAPELRVPALVDVEQRTGLMLSYATHVERL